MSQPGTSSLGVSEVSGNPYPSAFLPYFKMISSQHKPKVSDSENHKESLNAPECSEPQNYLTIPNLRKRVLGEEIVHFPIAQEILDIEEYQIERCLVDCDDENSGRRDS